MRSDRYVEKGSESMDNGSMTTLPKNSEILKSHIKVQELEGYFSLICSPLSA
jgi:hypothetical protein